VTLRQREKMKNKHGENLFSFIIIAHIFLIYYTTPIKYGEEDAKS
jgi:hypothetical protein